MVHQGEWKKVDSKNRQIPALTTRIKSLEAKMGDDGGNRSGGGETPKKNLLPGTKVSFG